MWQEVRRPHVRVAEGVGGRGQGLRRPRRRIALVPLTNYLLFPYNTGELKFEENVVKYEISCMKIGPTLPYFALIF